jgi:hypothetical protein
VAENLAETWQQLGKNILFSVVFTHSFPSHYGSVLVLPVISLHFNCIAGAGKPYYMMGEVSWDPKRRRPWPSFYLILFPWQPFKIASMNREMKGFVTK